MIPADLIDNPSKAIEFVNKKIRRLEEMSETARLHGDLVTASRCEGHLVKYMDILQHYIRQDWQQAGGPKDISKTLSEGGGKKKRFE